MPAKRSSPSHGQVGELTEMFLRRRTLKDARVKCRLAPCSTQSAPLGAPHQWLGVPTRYCLGAALSLERSPRPCRSSPSAAAHCDETESPMTSTRCPLRSSAARLTIARRCFGSTTPATAVGRSPPSQGSYTRDDTFEVTQQPPSCGGVLPRERVCQSTSQSSGQIDRRASRAFSSIGECAVRQSGDTSSPDSARTPRASEQRSVLLAA